MCGRTGHTGSNRTLQKLCFDTLMAEGVKAKLALEAGACTPAVEKSHRSQYIAEWYRI